MENFKFIMSSVIILIVVVLLGYWAVATIEPGSLHVDRQRQQDLEDRNEELEKKVAELESELRALQASEEEPTLNEEVPVTPTPSTPSTGTTSSAHQALIVDLEELIEDKVNMKEKSRGTRVGTVQTFLNIYNNTSKKVDNDYGAGTKADVIKFQREQGLTADGEAGPTTFAKMIEWLRKQ